MCAPDEARLGQNAKLFGKTIEYLCRDDRVPVPGTPSFASESGPPQRSDTAIIPHETGVAALMKKLPAIPHHAFISVPKLLIAMQRDKVKAVYQVEVSVTAMRLYPATNRPTFDRQTCSMPEALSTDRKIGGSVVILNSSILYFKWKHFNASRKPFSITRFCLNYSSGYSLA